MKSRTSSFNTALRKNITRFAPAWGLYTLLLVLILTTAIGPAANYWTVQNMADFIMIMAVLNLCYALLTAQLLFGDLFNSRLCNALHAMPLRREGWFAAGVTAGLIFSLIPTLVTTLTALPLCAASEVINGWQVPLYWFLGSNLSYICFFGIAALCVQLTGNRFAMAVVYGILNFGAVITYWLVDTIYTPLFYGVQTVGDPFFRLTPVYHMAEAEYIDVARHNIDLPDYYADFTVTGDWSRLAVWAVVGVALLGLALLLYRKRNLECAGDFMAFKKMEPVFLLIYTLIAGTCFQFFTTNVIGSYSDMFYLFVGIAVGWFTGQMLLKRTIRVFKWKSIGACALLMVLLGASLVACALDVFGIASWVPDSSQVKTAYVYMGYISSDRIPSDAVVLDSPEDIETAIRVHELALVREEVIDDEVKAIQTIDADTYVYTYADTDFNFTLIYELKDGRTVRRYYHSYAAGEIGQLITPWFSSVEAVLGIPEEELDAFADSIYETLLDGNTSVFLTDEQLRSLLDAIAADCRAGNMVQRWNFHVLEDNPGSRFYVEFSSIGEDRLHLYRSITVFDCCENTIRWMDENDMWAEMQEYQEKYG